MSLVETLRALPEIGFADEDNADVRLRKRTAILTSVIAALVVTPWTIFYYFIGIPTVAVIPTFYIVATGASLVYIWRTKKDGPLRLGQLLMFLMLPPLVHIALGGFENSSGVVMYASVGAVGAASFSGSPHPWRWFAAFAATVAALIPFESTFRQWAPDVGEAVVISFFAANIVSTALINFLALLAYVRSRNQLADDLAEEQRRSEHLLLNVLPASIAERLKDGERPIADRHEQVGVLFADIVDFTPLSETLAANELVEGLNELFSTFDALTLERGLEKVKTIGDAYMVVSGAPDPGPGVAQLADLALEMRDRASLAVLGDRQGVSMRFGIDVGPLIAGVIGESRFIYDVYGDTVNTASRMESNGVAGKIQLTSRVAAELGDEFVVESRGTVDIKGKGPTKTLFLVGRRD